MIPNARLFFNRIVFLLFTVSFLCSCTEEPGLETSFEVTSVQTAYEFSIDVMKLGEGPVGTVFYVVDGDDLLPIIHQEVALPTGTACLFVGIDYKGKNYRTRDFTFTERGKDTGKASEFLSFITTQLDQQLREEGIVPTEASRGLIGHSLGGLFGSYTFTQNEGFFSKFLIMSPALFWDDYRFFAVEADSRAANAGSTAEVFLAVGEAEDLGMNNSYKALQSILEQHYPNVRAGYNIASGSHFKSRNENLGKGVAFLVE